MHASRSARLFGAAILTAGFLGGAGPVPAAGQEARSARVVHYDMNVRLDPAARTVFGRVTLVWRNDSDRTVAEMPFHLYFNAFRNNLSTFMKESGGAHRGFRLGEEDWGWCRVEKIGVRGGADLTPSMIFIQPDDGNPDDRTVMQVALPEPVGPGESVVLEIDFTSKFPRIFARAGFSGDFFMAGQWFPKIGVLWNGEWNCHQYHANSEFFADFGVYEVALTVPSRFVVGATGRRVRETDNGDGTKTVVHRQEDVHDFAWAACPDFVESRERFRMEEPGVDTEMIFLVHKAHLKQKPRYVAALRQGLEFYSRNYGPYPYETVTLVDPAPGAMGAGGMEYPTLFTGMTMSYLPAGLRVTEMVTIHEFGHGYWYGIVGSNEFEEAWLDEGINTYSEIKAMAAYYGADRSMVDFPGLRIGDLTFQRMNVIGSGRFDPILRRSWEFISGSSYALNVYNKAGLMLLTLEKILGEETMGRVMKAYYETWKFRHPTTADFVRTAEAVSGRDLGWFFDQVLISPDKLDYAVTDLTAGEIPKGRGEFDVKSAEDEPETSSPEAPKTYRNTVVVARLGEWVMPQDVEIVFADGTIVRERWDGRERWIRYVYEKPVKVERARVDPEGIYILDANWTNNAKRLDPPRAPVRRLVLGFLGWIQHLLSLAHV